LLINGSVNSLFEKGSCQKRKLPKEGEGSHHLIDASVNTLFEKGIGQKREREGGGQPINASVDTLDKSNS